MKRTACLFAALALASFSRAAAQAPPWVWENATELSFVSTGGNASSSTLGLKATLTGTGEPNAFKVEVGGIRAQTKFTSLSATGTPASFQVDEVTTSEVTAENYFARARYDRTLGGAYVFGGAGWDRNTFAGVQNRFQLVAGFGRTWVEGESGRFKSDLGGTYTIQNDVDPLPGANDAFGGARVSLDATRRLTATTELASTLIADQNLEERGDFRTDWVSSIAVAISQGLALKTSFQLMFDAEPANLSVPLFSSPGNPTGQNVLTPGEKVDTILTLTLVIKL